MPPGDRLQLVRNSAKLRWHSSIAILRRDIEVAFTRLRPTIRTALLGLVGIPLIAMVVGLAYDTSERSQADIAEAYRVATAINDIAASQTEQFLSRAEYVLSELSRRPQVRALDRANCDPLLADWKQLQPAYANILTLDATGLLVCSATGIQPGQAAGPDPRYYFSETVRTRKFTAGKPAKGFITGRWVSTLAYPIQNSDGQVIGVVAAAVDLAQFQSFGPTGKLKADGVFGIINGEGTIIARSEEAEQRVGRVSDAVSAKIMLAQRRGVMRSRDYRGIDRLYAFTSIPRSDWIAFTSLDTAAVLAPAQRLALERLALVIAAMLAITALTLWASRRIAKPVEALSKTIAALTDGKLDARPIADGPLEIYQIAVEFSAMLDTLAITTESLRANRATLDAALDSMGDAVFISDTEGLFIHFNAAFATFHKFRNKEECAKTLVEYPMFLQVYSASGELLPLEQWAVPRALRGETAANVEFTLKRIDTGETWTGSYNYSPIHGKDGAIVGSVVTARDVTDFKQAQESQRIAATAFESRQGMFITNAQTVILQVNKAFTEVTGYTAEQAVGKTPRLLGSGRHDSAFYAAMWENINSTGQWHGEIFNRRKDGTVYPESLNISAVRNENGVATHYVGSFHDLSATKAAQDQIETLAFSDLLTGLPNRRMLMVQLQQLMLASEQDKRQGALLLVDLDNFKDLNDALGHDQGDLLLQQLGERLSACTKEGETVARVGGDEFVVLLTQLASSPLEAAMHAETVANRILAALRQPYRLGGSEISCSASIGVALFGARHEDAVEPLKRAELAMYEAKGHGRNTLRFFDPQMQDAVNARVAMEAALRQAIEAHQFVLLYQAQVSDQDRITGVEALLRWPDPKRGMVSPAEFIPLAEATGLILPIGIWVLEAACKQLAQWARQPGLAHLSVAVNVSAKQFHQSDFVDQVLITLARTGANPARLKIELTETVLVANVEDVIAKMNTLKGRGVGFSIDDFGTGYSSLAYLKRLPLDQLKIDQGFIRDILIDSDDAAIAKMVVALADSMEVAVIAEGVETEAQRDFLAALGCHKYEGHLLSPALPAHEFEVLVARGQA